MPENNYKFRLATKTEIKHIKRMAELYKISYKSAIIMLNEYIATYKYIKEQKKEKKKPIQ